jgi:hypothetical protein
VTVLLIDALIALTKTIDRGLAVVEKNVRRHPTLRGDVDARPAGADASATAGTGGHPIRATSALLAHAVRELDYAYPAKLPAVIRDLQAELRDRAANLAAQGD